MADPQGIHVGTYNELIKDRAISVQRLGKGTYQIIIKQFKGSTGEELPPVIQPANKQGIDTQIQTTKAQIAEHQEALRNLLAIQATITALEESKENLVSKVIEPVESTDAAA